VKRTLFNLAAGLSLLLCVTTVVLWVRSYWVWDSFNWDGKTQSVDRLSLSVGSGKVYLVRSRMPAPTSPSLNGQYSVSASSVSFSEPLGFSERAPFTPIGKVVSPTHSFAGLGSSDRTMMGVHMQDIRVPLWMPIVLCLIVPTLGRIVRRPKNGFCKQCRYDLTGNTSGTCPECGTPVPEKSEVMG
jgi:hypothetical protein